MMTASSPHPSPPPEAENDGHLPTAIAEEIRKLREELEELFVDFARQVTRDLKGLRSPGSPSDALR